MSDQLQFRLGSVAAMSRERAPNLSKSKSKSIWVVKVYMVKERELLYHSKISNPETAAQVIQEFLAGADRENLIVMCLDTKNNITAINTVSIGSLNASIIHPREVFKPAILSNASGIILAHNHPSGDPFPSDEDRSITGRLVEAGKILGIDTLDHIIVGDGSSYSFKKHGLM